MSWRLWKPRPISSYEAQVIRRVVEVDGTDQCPPALLEGIERLVVQEEGEGSAHHDSLDFMARGRYRYHGSPLASAIGSMSNGKPVELIVWADRRQITGLEIEPYEGTRLPARMPLLETIRPYPESLGDDGDEEDAAESDRAGPSGA